MRIIANRPVTDYASKDYLRPRRQWPDILLWALLLALTGAGLLAIYLMG